MDISYAISAKVAVCACNLSGLDGKQAQAVLGLMKRAIGYER